METIEQKKARLSANAARWRERHPEKVKEYYSSPKGREFQNAANRRGEEKRRRFINLLKMDRPCYDCGGMFEPHVMDWDHVTGEKKFTIGANQRSHKLEDVIDEINKCQLVCANCHRLRTMARKKGELI
jgi:hypothetical protein